MTDRSSITDAFVELAAAADGRWDGVDAAEHVAELRGRVARLDGLIPWRACECGADIVSVRGVRYEPAPDGDVTVRRLSATEYAVVPFDGDVVRGESRARTHRCESITAAEYVVERRGRPIRAMGAAEHNCGCPDCARYRAELHRIWALPSLPEAGAAATLMQIAARLAREGRADVAGQIRDAVDAWKAGSARERARP
jgi:hypothetical protein